MANRRRRIGSRGGLVIGGAVIVSLVVLFVTFPIIAGSILGGVESNEYKFAFPDIDTILIPQAQLTPTSTFTCFFKYSILAKNSIDQVIQTQESNFNSEMRIFVTTDISVPTGQTIDRYEVTPKIRCNKNTGDTSFETGLVVLPSTIGLSVSFSQPDGTVVRLPNKQFTVQSTGADNTIIITDPIFGILKSITGVLKQNTEIKFKSTLGALSPDQFWTIRANEIDDKLQALPDRYSTDVTFQVFGQLNIRNVFSEQVNTFFLFPTSLTKSVQIGVDKRADVPPSATVQTITILSAVTNAGQILVGNNETPLNPDGTTSQRTVQVRAELKDYQSLVESIPTLQLTHQSGSRVSGTSAVTMFGGGATGIFTGTIIVPSSIADGTYLFKVTNTRDQVGQASFSVATPPPDQIEPTPCTTNCDPDPPPVTVTCDQGFRLVDNQCVAEFCPDGTSAINGCVIKPILGGQCLQGQIEQPDGSCLNPNCPPDSEWNQSLLRCISTITDEEPTPPPPTEEEKEGNILNIRQELRYRLVTTDQSGLRTPVESGIIPPDESLFAQLTELQFIVVTEANPTGVKFDVMEVDSFLVVPQTLSSPQITNVNLNQKLHFYHKNPILSDGTPTDSTSPALAVNIPAGTISQIKTATGGGFFALGKMTITTSEILSTVAPITFGLEEQRTTNAGVELKEGEIISLMYVIDGDFDLSTDAGTRQFDGVIKQMRYWKNLIYTDKVLNGDQCTGMSGRALLQCTFDATGNNVLEGLCPPDPDKTVKQNFDECLASLDDRTIDLVINKACEDTSGFDALIEILNVESGFTEEFGGTGVKSTEDILRDLQLASGCDPETIEVVTEEDAFECASGTRAQNGVTPTSQEQCFGQCSEELTMIIGGGEVHIKDDGTVECRAPPTNGGAPMCQSGSERDMTTGECVFPPAQPPSETVTVINNLLDTFQKFLESFTNTNEKEITGGGGSGGNAPTGGACGGNILNCIVELFGVDEEPTEIIPPELQIGGSSTNTIILFVVVIIAILVIAVIVRRRRGV